jgi:serine/threonine-protein kinase
MSPEQAKGKPVDQRADIYTFGAVLYEMLTGKRLHRGETNFRAPSRFSECPPPAEHQRRHTQWRR